MSPTEKGAAFGAGGGALLGGVIGGNAKSAGIGALAGAGLGAILGNLNGQNQQPGRYQRPVQPNYESRRELPFGRMIRPGLVRSPYTGTVIGVRGLPAGAVIQDPQTGQRFRIPYPQYSQPYSQAYQQGYPQY